MNRPLNPWDEDDYRWHTPGISDTARVVAERENLASLRRKITYCLRRPNSKLYFQRVEGWTTRQILAYMEDNGIPRERILKNLQRTGIG